MWVRTSKIRVPSKKVNRISLHDIDFGRRLLLPAQLWLFAENPKGKLIISQRWILSYFARKSFPPNWFASLRVLNMMLESTPFHFRSFSFLFRRVFTPSELIFRFFRIVFQFEICFNAVNKLYSFFSRPISFFASQLYISRVYFYPFLFSVDSLAVSVVANFFGLLSYHLIGCIRCITHSLYS